MDQVKIEFPLDRYEIEDGVLWPPVTTEVLWGESAADGSYEVRNVPFYAKGVSLGDNGYAVPKSDGSSNLAFTAIARRGGHATFRALLRENVSPDDPAVKDLLNAINQQNSFYESTDQVLFAFDIPPIARVDTVYGLLQLGSKWGLWDLQEGHYEGPRAT